jgi:putative inorganic carbon (HCO3(-)) transporter
VARHRQKSSDQRAQSQPLESLISSDPVFAAAQLLVLLKLAIVVFVFYPPASDSFALIKSVMSHVTALGLLACLVWLGVRHRHAIVRITPIHVAMLGLVVAFVLATPFAVDRTIALFGVPRRYLGLDQVLDDALLFAAVALLFPLARDRARLAFGLVAIGAVVCAYGLVQLTGHDFVRYVENPGTRPIGAFGQPDTAAAFFGMFAVSTLAVAAWPWSRVTRLLRLIAAAAALSAIVLGQATGARAFLIAFAGGLVGAAVIGVMARVGLRWDTRRLAVVTSTLMLALAASFISLAPGLAPRFGLSGESRLEIWGTAVRAIAQRPVLGVGPDNFAAVYPALHDIRSIVFSSTELQNSTHNLFLYVATSSGILGLITLAAVLVLTVVRAVRAAADRQADALVLVLVAAYVGQGLVTITDMGLEWIPFVAAGLAAASWPGGAVSRARAATGPASQAATAALLTLAAAVVLALGQFTRIQASQLTGDAQAALGANLPLIAVDRAGQALRIDNTRAETWGLFGTALSQAGNPSAAGSAFEEATSRAPWNPTYWRDLALTHAARGDAVRAMSYLERTLAADPYDLAANDLLARLAFNAGNWQRALEAGSLAVRLDPADIGKYEAPARAAIKLQLWQRAEDLLKAAIAQKDTAHLRVLLATVYVGMGRIPDAAAQVDLALAVEPGNQEATELKKQIGRP